MLFFYLRQSRLYMLLNQPQNYFSCTYFVFYLFVLFFLLLFYTFFSSAFVFTNLSIWTFDLAQFERFSFTCFEPICHFYMSIFIPFILPTPPPRCLHHPLIIPRIWRYVNNFNINSNKNFFVAHLGKKKKDPTKRSASNMFHENILFFCTHSTNEQHMNT